jgi:hypothetical protein
LTKERFMPAGILFWVLMILTIVFAGAPLYAPGNRWFAIGPWICFVLAVAILGWKIFGGVIQ